MGILEREWEAQSGCAGPLAITAPVRDAIELVFAGAPGGVGVFALAPSIHDPADSPQALIDRLRDRMPAEIPPWNMRALGRVERLRTPAALLPAPETASRVALPPPATAPPAPRSRCAHLRSRARRPMPPDRPRHRDERRRS